jgi:hypothetical protein
MGGTKGGFLFDGSVESLSEAIQLAGHEFGYEFRREFLEFGSSVWEKRD